MLVQHTSSPPPSYKLVAELRHYLENLRIQRLSLEIATEGLQPGRATLLYLAKRKTTEREGERERGREREGDH